MPKKFLTILLDGMADYPSSSGGTPMTDADKPTMDYLAARAEVGLCRTVPSGMKPGSDVANLSVLGYDPKVYYTGRSPLEALSMGVSLGEGDVSYRCNLVTLSDEADYFARSMVDYSAGEIDSDSARTLVEFLAQALGAELHAGVSYRHCLVRRGARVGGIFTPPHDITGRNIAEFLPRGEGNNEFLGLMMRSASLLASHPINLERIRCGKRPANSIWLWGEGVKPTLPDFFSLFNRRGAIVSAVDLLKGIGIAAGLETPIVAGATGTIDTNYDGKLAAVKDAFGRCDYVYLHLEAPDECGHQQDYQLKTRAITLADRLLVKPLCEFLAGLNEPYRIAILPDHATPVSLGTHVSDPVPYLIYDSERECRGVDGFSERTAASTARLIESGVAFAKRFLGESV